MREPAFGKPALAAVATLWLIAAFAAAALADAKIGKFTVTFAEGVFHRNGDFVIPGAVNGVSSDGDFKADRAFGNYQRQDVTLVGHVVLHERSNVRGTGPPLTLTSNQLRVEGKPSVYTATGAVVVTQGNRRLRSDYLWLNNTTHRGILRGHVTAQQNDRVVNTSEVHYNTASGDLVVPTPLSGFSSNADFRADRAVGNNKAGTLTLLGHVIVHRINNAAANNASEPLTLWCDKLDVTSKPQETYTCTGHVKVAQGDKTLVAPKLRLNNTTHIADMTGGVHGEEKPDRSFDAAELLYNTQTQDFKALGGVRATFPFRRGVFAASPAPSPRGNVPVVSPAPRASAPATPAPSPAPPVSQPSARP